MASVVDNHPQKQEIIEGLLAGKSVRSVSRTVNPPIAHSTLSVYRHTILARAAKGFRANELGHNILKDVIISTDPNNQDKAAAGRLESALRTESMSVVRSKMDRQNRWIQQLEKTPMLDSNGVQVVLDGVPQFQPDHRALAAHDRNQTSDLDLLARLGQLYQEAGESGPGLTAVMSFGDVNVYIGAQPQTAQAPQVIEVECEPLDVGIVRAGNKR